MSSHLPPRYPAMADDTAPVDRITERRTMANTPLAKYFQAAVKFEASDLIMKAGVAPRLRLRGELKALDAEPLPIEEFEKYVEASLSESQWRYYAEHGSIDLGIDFDFGAAQPQRFRCNIFRSRGLSSVSARRVNNSILTFDELFLPPVLSQVADKRQGLVLVAGITSSGKSTTIASMLQHVNKSRSCHVVTIEDPIEYLFVNDKATISQREIGIDVPSFTIALKALVRENPDVVLIGEMRDQETFESALQAAETGHLVFGTIHASSAPQAFGRIYDLFPAAQRELIRTMLAYQMQAFIYQKLLPTIREEPQYVPAVEVLLQSPAVRKRILEGKEHELDEVIRDSRDSGMQTFTDSLVELVRKEYIHPKVAMTSASNPEEVKMRMRGINAAR